VQATISNVIVSFALAIMAFFLAKLMKHPHLLHLIWLLVLVKLVTPHLSVWEGFITSSLV
jgi:hypothetical protein